MSKPRTAAGRALLAEFMGEARTTFAIQDDPILHATLAEITGKILAIEAQAATPDAEVWDKVSGNLIPAGALAHPFERGGLLSTTCAREDCLQAPAAAIHRAAASPASEGLRAKPPVKWVTIRQDATERGLYAVVDDAMIARPTLTPSRRKLIVGNIVMAVAKWRESFRDCGCWRTEHGYAFCDWHEQAFRPQREEAERLGAALAAAPERTQP